MNEVKTKINLTWWGYNVLRWDVKIIEIAQKHILLTFLKAVSDYHT